jgi:hypothetical protein
MVIVVESDKEIGEFLNSWNTESSVVVPVWVDLDKHPLHNQLAFLYIKFGSGEYIIPYNHIDCKPITIDLSQSTQPKWVWNKKSLLQTGLGIQNGYDTQYQHFFTLNQSLEFKAEEQPFISHYHKLGMRDDLGKIAPIMKWVEYLQLFTKDINPIPFDFDKGWIDDTMIPILSDIERFGVRVDGKKFIDRYPQASKHLHNDTIYTQYNPYTVTSRPSNRFGGINFSALNKSDGTREVFIPKEGQIFLQMDYDAYHPRIIGKLIGYELPQTSVHQWLADQYGVSYDEGKGVTFQLLYGGIPEEFYSIPYYKSVGEYINNLWDTTTKMGYLQTHRRKIPLNRIEAPNPQKVFNYLLQATETELNMVKLEKILAFIKQTDIELSLYTYDSFLFSYPIDSDTVKAKKLKEIIEDGGFPIKASWGTDYDKL